VGPQFVEQEAVKQNGLKKSTLIQFSNNGIRLLKIKQKQLWFRQLSFPLEYQMCGISLNFFCDLYSNLF
jgi:hypothetical protein